MMSFSFTKNRLSVMDFSPPVEYSSVSIRTGIYVKNRHISCTGKVYTHH